MFVTLWTAVTAPGATAGAPILEQRVVLVPFVLLLVFGYFATVGVVNFAHEDSFGAAFDFGTIEDVGLSGDFAVPWLISVGIFIGVSIVTGFLNIIPFLGTIIGAFLNFYAFIVASNLWADGYLESSANTTRLQTVSAGTNAPSSAGRTTVQGGNSSESTGDGATTTSSTAVASDVAADASGGQAAEKSAAGADAVDDPSTPDEREGAEAPETTPSTAPEQHEIQPPLSGSGPETTPSTAPEGSSDLASDADSDAGTAPGSGGPSEDVPTVETIADRAASTQDPSDIRDLGERANEEPVPEEAIRALKSCMEAEDPDVRVAVCEACGEIPGEEVESILGRLRIDTNDCVAEAAMDAY